MLLYEGSDGGGKLRFRVQSPRRKMPHVKGVLEGCRDQNGRWVIGVRSLVAVCGGVLCLPSASVPYEPVGLCERVAYGLG